MTSSAPRAPTNVHRPRPRKQAGPPPRRRAAWTKWHARSREGSLLCCRIRQAEQAARSQLAELDRQIAALTGEVQALQAGIERKCRLDEEIPAQEDALRRLENDSIAADKRSERLCAEIDALSARIAELRSTLTFADSSAAEQEISRLQHRADALEQAAAAAQEREKAALTALTATRAEIAVIVSRLLLPGQRVSHDSRINTAMSAQMGNYYQGGLAVQSGDTVYYGFRDDRKADSGECYGLIARKTDGSTKTVFTSNRAPDSLYLSEDGAFYFLCWEKLLRYDPAADKLEEVYAAKGKIDSFQIYDGRLYVLENYSGDSNYPDQRRYRFGCVENGQFRSLMDGITFNQVINMDRFHIFNNKAYFLFGDSTEPSSSGSGYVFYNYALWSLDLETGQKGRAVDIDDFDMSEIAFDGATAYALKWDKDDTVPLRIVRFSLLQPELREVMATLPMEAKELYLLLFANGGDLYYLSSGAHRLWHIGSNGDVTVSAQLPWGDRTFEYATVTPQGVLFHDVSSLRMNDSSVFRVRLPDGSVVNCLDFLGLN